MERTATTPNDVTTTRFGKIRYGFAAILLGLPLPLSLLAFLMPGCRGN